MCTGPGSGQGQLPRIMNSLRDVQASYRAVPVDPYLGVRRLILKRLGERLEAACQPLGARGKLGVWSCRLHGCWGAPTIALLDQLVGEQQPGEQQLASLRQRPKAADRLAALGIDKAGRGPEGLLLAASAGDAVGAPGDDEIDLGHLSPRCPDQLIEIGNGFADLASKLFVAAVFVPAFERPLDPRKRPVRPFQCLRQPTVVHATGLRKKPFTRKH